MLLDRSVAAGSLALLLVLASRASLDPGRQDEHSLVQQRWEATGGCPACGARHLGPAAASPVADAVGVAKDVARGHNVKKAIAKTSAARFAKGTYNGAHDAVKGVVELGKAVRKNPAAVGAGLLDAAKHPVRTAKVAVKEYKKTYRTEYKRNGAAGAAGRATSEILLSVLGTKGIDKAAKVTKVTKSTKVDTPSPSPRNGSANHTSSSSRPGRAHPRASAVLSDAASVRMPKRASDAASASPIPTSGSHTGAFRSVDGGGARDALTGGPARLGMVRRTTPTSPALQRANPQELVGAGVAVRRSAGGVDTDWVVSGLGNLPDKVRVSYAGVGSKQIGIDQAMLAIQPVRDAAHRAIPSGAEPQAGTGARVSPVSDREMAIVGDTAPPLRHAMHLGGRNATDGVAAVVRSGNRVNVSAFTFSGPIAEAVHDVAARAGASGATPGGGAKVVADIERSRIGKVDENLSVEPFASDAFDQRALKRLRKDLVGNDAALRAVDADPVRILSMLRVNQKHRTPAQREGLEALGIPGDQKAMRLRGHAKIVTVDGERAAITTGAISDVDQG